MKKKNVLIIEDDERTSNFLVLALQKAGYNTSTAFNGEEGLSMYDNDDPDLILLDIILPKIDGWEVLHRLRQYSKVPVLMLTSEHDNADIVRGFNLGADDYISKPFSPGELIARMEAVLRRCDGSSPKSKSITNIGDLFFNPNKLTLSLNSNTVKLTKLEADLLAIFLQNNGNIVSYTEVMKSIWGYEFRDDLQLLRNGVSHLRRKIEILSPETSAMIKNVPRQGYEIAFPRQ